MLIADWKGGAFLRVLSSAERFKLSAIFLGLSQVKTPSSRSSAILFLVTSPDQFFFLTI